MLNLFNQLNLSLQGRDANILRNQNKIIAFIKKLNIWKTRINDSVVDMFPVAYGYIVKEPLINTILIFSDIQLYLLLLYSLKEPYENFDWILNLFVITKTNFLYAKKKN